VEAGHRATKPVQCRNLSSIPMKGGTTNGKSLRNDSKLTMELPAVVPPTPSSAVATSTVSRMSVKRKGWQKLKLRDYTRPIQGRIRKRRVIIAYKRAHYRRFVRTHTRRIHDLYILERCGDFLDSFKFLNNKNLEKPYELLTLVEEFKLPALPQLVPVVTRVDLPQPTLVKPVEKQLSKLNSHPPLENLTPDKSPDKQLVKLISQPPLEKFSPEKAQERLGKLPSLPSPLERSPEKQLGRVINHSLEMPTQAKPLSPVKG